jgi:hypothetical protein
VVAVALVHGGTFQFHNHIDPEVEAEVVGVEVHKVDNGCVDDGSMGHKQPAARARPWGLLVPTASRVAEHTHLLEGVARVGVVDVEVDAA